jgi:hypothetical protein
MSRLFSISASVGIGVWLSTTLSDPYLGVTGGVLMLLLFEVPRNSAEKRRLRIIGDSQTLRLQDANAQISRLDYHIQQQSHELQTALSEIERRDSVGAPEARKLIESQRATLQAQSSAMDEAKKLIESQEKMLKQLEIRTEDARGRWEDMVETMERVLRIQAEQADLAQRRLADESGRLTEAFAENSMEMQRTMTELLHRLALEPRTSTVSVKDSVVMGSTPAESKETISVVVGPHLKKPSRKIPRVPVVKLDARPLPTKGEHWVDAFNEDLV